MPCRFALRWRCFGARRKLASLTCPEALAWDCLAEAAGVVAETATCPKVAEQRWNLRACAGEGRLGDFALSARLPCCSRGVSGAGAAST